MWKFVVYVETLGSQWSSPTKSHRFEPRPFISRPKENRDDKINAAHIKHERNFRSTVFRRNKFREISVFALAKSRKTNFADSAQWARLAKFRRNLRNQQNFAVMSATSEIRKCFRRNRSLFRRNLAVFLIYFGKNSAFWNFAYYVNYGETITRNLIFIRISSESISRNQKEGSAHVWLIWLWWDT